MFNVRKSVFIRSGWGLRVKYFYHVSAFVISFNLICNMTMFGKRCILTFWPNQKDQRVGAGGVCG